MEQFNQWLGELVRAARVKAEFSQDHLAEAVGISRTTYIGIEAGRGRMDALLLFELATRLTLDVQQIYSKFQAMRVEALLRDDKSAARDFVHALKGMKEGDE